MELFDGVISHIIDVLSADTRLAQVDFVSAFRAKPKPNPLIKTLVTVGINGIEILDKALGQYLGIQNGKEVFGKGANICLLLRIHCPVRFGGEKCAEIFSMICNTLVFNDIGYKLNGLNCKDVDFDATSSCFVLDCLLSIDSFVTETTEQLNISNIKVKGEI